MWRGSALGAGLLGVGLAVSGFLLAEHAGPEDTIDGIAIATIKIGPLHLRYKWVLLSAVVLLLYSFYMLFIARDSDDRH